MSFGDQYETGGGGTATNGGIGGRGGDINAHNTTINHFHETQFVVTSDGFSLNNGAWGIVDSRPFRGDKSQLWEMVRDETGKVGMRSLKDGSFVAVANQEGLKLVAQPEPFHWTVVEDGAGTQFVAADLGLALSLSSSAKLCDPTDASTKVQVLEDTPETREVLKGVAEVLVAKLRSKRVGTKSGHQHPVPTIRKSFAATRDIDTRIKDIEKVLGPKITIPDFAREHSPCHAGTRVEILEDLFCWAHSSHRPNIRILCDKSGTGKSSIAASFGQQLVAVNGLGAQFYCRREQSAEHSVRTLWRSIAFDLMRRYHSYAEAIAAHFPLPISDLQFLSTEQLFGFIIAVPLAKATFGGPIVIIIDGIDQFGGPDAHSESRRELLATLESWSRFPTVCRLFLTTCSLPQNVELERIAVISTLGETPEDSSDILRYYRRHFASISADIDSLPSPWPSEQNLQILVDATANSFVCASAIIHIAKQSSDAVDDLISKLCNGPLDPPGINGLYRVIIDTAVDKADEDHFRAVIGAILTTPYPMSRATLSKLLSIDEGHVMAICIAIEPILNESETLSFRHQSFVDFLFDCPTVHRYQAPAQHKYMLNSCLKVLRSSLLHFNVAGLDSSYRIQNEAHHNHVPSHVRHASRTWLAHMAASGPLDATMLTILESFIREKGLFWLEVMCLENAIVQAYSQLKSVILQLQTGISSPLIQDFLEFIQQNIVPVAQNYAHIYISALPFFPTLLNSVEGVDKRFQGYLSCVNSIELSHGGKRISADPAKNVDVEGETSSLESFEPVGTPLQGHTAPVHSVGFSPDEKKIVSGSYDHTVRVWDAVTFQPIGDSLLGHTSCVSAVAFSQDGQRILSGSHDTTVRVWDAETRQLIGQPLQGHSSAISSVSFSLDGRHIISEASDRTTRVWDAETLQPIGTKSQGHASTGSSTALSPDRRIAASGSSNNVIRLSDAKNNQVIGDLLQGHTEHVCSLAFSPDGRKLASGSIDRTVRVWDIETRRPIGEPLQGHTRTIWAVAFSPHGKSIVSGSADNTIRVWSLTNRQPVGQSVKGRIPHVFAAAFSPDGRRIVSSSHDNLAYVLDAATYQPVGQPLRGHQSRIFSVEFSPDGRRIATGSHDCSVRVWDAETHQPIGQALQGHTSTVSSVAFSPDGRTIVSGSTDRSIHAWNAQTYQPIEPLVDVLASSSFPVSFSPDGRRIVNGSRDGTIRIWNLDSSPLLRKRLRDHANPVTTIAFSPDGRRIVSGSNDGTLIIWNATTYQPTGEPLRGHGKSISSVTFSPDSLRIVSASYDTTLLLWIAETGQRLKQSLEGHTSWVTSVAYSPNGDKIASGSYDNTVRIWHAKMQQPIGQPLRGHSMPVVSVAFSPDGTRVMSSSTDETVRIWDLGNFDPLREVPAVNKLVTGGVHGKIHTIPLSDIPLFLTNDGWVVGSDGKRLLFIPEEFRLWLPVLPCLAILGARPMVKPDVTKLKHGGEWTQYYRPG